MYYHRRMQQGGVLRALLLVVGVMIGSVPPEVSLADAQTGVDADLFDLSVSKGVAAFNQGDYAAAESFFRQALDARPEDADSTYYLGQTLLRRRQYESAAEAFRRVLETDAGSGQALLGLGMAQYYQDHYPEALAALKDAQTALPNEPLVYYFQGLAYNGLGAYTQSLPVLTKAMLLSPELAPDAHYQRGVAHYQQGIYDEARVEFETAIAAQPDSTIAESGRRYLARMRSGDKPPRIAAPAGPKRWDAAFSVSGQYDSNVVLLPLGTQPSPGLAGISQKDDFRWVFFGRGEYRFLQNETWTVGSGYSFYQSFHQTLSGFDVQDHTPMLYVQHRFGRLQSRIDYLFDYVSVGRSPYLVSHAVRPVFTVREGDRWFTQVQLGYQNKDFQHGRFLFNSARDAKNWLIGITQFMSFAEGKGLARIGYIFDSDRTGGGSPAVASVVPSHADWAYMGHRVSTGLTLPPVWTLVPDLTFDYYRQNYDNPNSFSGTFNSPGRTVRADDIVVITAGLSRHLTSSLTAGIQYSYTRDHSNVAIFDYERSVVALTFSGTF